MYYKILARIHRQKLKHISKNSALILDKEANEAKKYRINNNEKYKKSLEKKRKNPLCKYKYYKHRAMNCGIKFDLTFENCYVLFIQACYYCGYIPINDTYNGIDRKYNNEYNIDECVSCCKMCNFIKNCLDYEVFLLRCEHILVYLKIKKGKSYPELFPNSYNKIDKYNSYKLRAIKKNLDFKLTKNEFNIICSQDCYLCGKKSIVNTNWNGIDRIINTKGYTLDNCKPCCSECNYMKNNYDYTDFLQKICNIYNHNLNKYTNNQIILRINYNAHTLNRNTNKLRKKISKEEIQSRHKNRFNREKIIQYYNNSDALHIHAKKLLDERLMVKHVKEKYKT